jgi:hypothetical protein
MKKIVANMTMGNDMSPLFPDIINVMNVPILEIKKMVYLYLINYARSKPDMAMMAITMFIKVNYSERVKEPHHSLGISNAHFNITGRGRPQSTYSRLGYPNNGIYSG